MPPKILRGQLFTGIPNSINAFLITSIDTTDSSYSLCRLEWEGGIVDNFPIENRKLSEILSTPSVEAIAPGEDPPATSQKRNKSGRRRNPPKVGDIRGENVCTGYDFTSGSLIGRRRVRDPDTGRKGYPIWKTKT